MAATATKKVFEFTTDEDELNDDGTANKETMCDFYKLNLPASASILSKQIAKSQAKRAEKEDRRRRRIDLSTVREQDETKLSASEEHSNAASSPAPPPPAPIAQDIFHTPRSRVDNASVDAKLRRKASLPEETRKSEPMDEEEVQLLALLLSEMETSDHRKFSLPVMTPMHAPQPTQQLPPTAPPTPGLPRMPPNMKVSEWLLERSTSPDNLSVGTSVMLEDSGLVLNYEEEDDDEFFDAPEENVHDQNAGLSLNRNMAMTQSLVRVEEETVTDGGMRDALMNGMRSARSTSVSPRPTIEQQFVRQSPISATFNVKHSHTMVRNNQPITNHNNNGLMTVSQQLTSTPLSSRTARSVLRVHNINSSANPQPKFASSTRGTSRSQAEIETSTPSPRPHPTTSNHTTPQTPQVLINPSTPSRPASVASSIGGKSTSAKKASSNLEGLQDLIHMQEEALRRAADGQIERKMSWHSDMDANRQSTSIHSSVGSLSSSKSVDGNNTLNKNGATPLSKIPGPRSRLPTPRGSNVAKRVSIGIQTDIPWPPPCVLRHRSHSLSAVMEAVEQSMEQEELEMESRMNVSDYQISSRAPSILSTSHRRLARSSLLSSSSNCDSSLASHLLKPPRYYK